MDRKGAMAELLNSMADPYSMPSSDDDCRSIFGHAKASNNLFDREEADLDHEKREAAEKAKGEAASEALPPSETTTQVAELEANLAELGPKALAPNAPLPGLCRKIVVHITDDLPITSFTDKSATR